MQTVTAAAHLHAQPLLLELSAPQLALLVQGVNELGGQLDVVAEHLLVLSDAVDVTHPPRQVPVDPRGQLAVAKL